MSELELLRAQVRDLQAVVRLLVYHCRRGLRDSEAQRELDGETDGTPMQD